MAIRTVISELVPEASTCVIHGVLLDEDNNLIPSSALAALTLTLYEPSTGQIVNGRDHQTVLNANGGSVDASGNVRVELTPQDTAILTGGKIETRVALFEWTYDTGKAGKHEVIFRIQNLEKV